MRTSEIAETFCPHCKAVHDRSSSVDPDETPSPGDVAICINCGCWCEYGPALELVKPCPERAAFIAGEPQCRLAEYAWRHAKGARVQ